MFILNYNFHTHTSRCGHASGCEEDYVIYAIHGGIKNMGFSDHIPFMYPDGVESFYRVPMNMVDSYFETIGTLREKYSEQIKINIGFESEYYPKYFSNMLKNSRQWGTEYLILGQHCVESDHPDGVFVINETADCNFLKNYVNSIIEAMETGVFTYVAHPDIFNFVGDEEIYKEEMFRLCESSKKSGIPLELNFLGIRQNRNYPRDLFWEIAGKVKAPVTFGFDAHDVESAYDGYSLEKARSMVKKYGLNYIGMPNLIIL